MLRDLGAAFYATKTDRATPTTDADIDRLVAALQTHESEHGALTLAPESAAAAPTATTTAPPRRQPRRALATLVADRRPRRRRGPRPARRRPLLAPAEPAAPAPDGADALTGMGLDRVDVTRVHCSSSPRGGAVW